MIRVLCIVVCLFASQLIGAQWSTLGPGLDQGVRAMLYDSTESRVYCFGHFTGSDDIQLNGTAYWSDEEWYPMGEGIDDVYGFPVLSGVKQGDSVLVAGFFHAAVNVSDTRYVAMWNGSEWTSIGTYGAHGITQALLANDDGWTIGGRFDSVAGQAFDKLARYSNGAWERVYSHPLSDPYDAFTAAAKYQGKYVFGGNINGMPGINEIGVLVDDTLRPMGSGIMGDSWVNAMEVYRGELYVAGEFYASSGNPASCVMKWDGTSWSTAFPGVQFITQAVDLDIHNGELYISGRSIVPGQPDYYSLARYDGERICLFGKNLNTVFLAIAGTEEYLYAAPNMITLGFGGDTVNYIARYDLSYLGDTCLTIATGIAEESRPADFSIHPNPAAEAFSIRLSEPTSVNVPLEVFLLDATGRRVRSYGRDMVRSLSDLDVRGLDAGTYLVRVHSADGQLDTVCPLVVE